MGLDSGGGRKSLPDVIPIVASGQLVQVGRQLLGNLPWASQVFGSEPSSVGEEEVARVGREQEPIRVGDVLEVRTLNGHLDRLSVDKEEDGGGCADEDGRRIETHSYRMFGRSRLRVNLCQKEVEIDG